MWRGTRAAHTNVLGLFICSWKEKEHFKLFTEHRSQITSTTLEFSHSLNIFELKKKKKLFLLFISFAKFVIKVMRFKALVLILNYVAFGNSAFLECNNSACWWQALQIKRLDDTLDYLEVYRRTGICKFEIYCFNVWHNFHSSCIFKYRTTQIILYISRYLN